MVYIITEDSNSARDFWKIVADTFIGAGKYILQPLPEGGGGNTRLQEQVTCVFSKIEKGDVLFVAFDNIGNTTDFLPSDFIIKTFSRCQEKGVHFRYTTYYCFEEVFLSYDELVKLSDNYKEIKLVEFVNKCINRGIDYYNDSVVQNYISQNVKVNLSNREHFLNYLLIEASKMIKGHFQITKSGQCFSNRAECWVKDCLKIQNKMTQQQVSNVCDIQCQYCCKGKTIKDKLIDLNNKSMFTRHSNYQLYEITKI